MTREPRHAPGDAETDESSLRYEGWRVAGASGLGVFLASILVYTFPIFLKPLAEEFSWSREAVSTAYGVLALMSALCSVPLGYLFDRFGPRTVVLPCVIAFGTMFASLGLLTARLWHLYATFAVLGAVATGLSPLAYARAISTWFERRRGVALAFAISGGAIGGVVHPPAAQWLVRSIGWRGACVALGAVVVAVGVPVAARFIREHPSARAGAGAGRSGASGAVIREGLQSRVFWILVIVIFCSSISQNAAIVHLAALLTDRGVSTERAALALSAMGAASITGRLLTGWLLDRFFAARVSFMLLTLAALGTFLLSSADSFATGALAAICIGFGMGGESDVTPYLISRYFGLRALSTLYAFTWIATAAAGAIGPVLMGRAFDLTGSYEALLVRLAVMTFAVGALMLALPQYGGTRNEERRTKI